MGKKTPRHEEVKKVDRELWRTSLELAHDYRYSDRASVSNLATIHQVSWIQNPESPLPHSRLWSKTEFIRIPSVALRLATADEMEKYDKELHLDGDWIVFADAHIPLHDMELFERAMAIAKKFGIKKCVCGGDFVELDAFKTYFDKSAPWEYEKKKTAHTIDYLLSWFSEFVWLIGNHEVRMWKRLQGTGDEEDIFKIMLEKEHIGQVKYSTYPYAILNESWMLVHPKSYSRLQARNAYFLASKYLVSLAAKGKSPNGQYGVIACHGHLGGEGTDVSGLFRVADGMTMCDPDKVAYKKVKMDTSPEWRPGFFMLRNNYLYSFPKHGTDWDWWLDKEG